MNKTELSTLAERYLIRKGSYWYRPNAQGYTSNIREAGRYTLEEAERHTHPNGTKGPRDGLSFITEAEALSWTEHGSAETTGAMTGRDAVQAMVGPIREAMLSYVFQEAQPDRGDVFSWVDDHAQNLAEHIVAKAAALITAQQAEIEAEIEQRKAASRSVFLLQMGGNDLCKALRQIADGCDDPRAEAKAALNSKETYARAAAGGSNA